MRWDPWCPRALNLSPASVVPPVPPALSLLCPFPALAFGRFLLILLATAQPRKCPSCLTYIPTALRGAGRIYPCLAPVPCSQPSPQAGTLPPQGRGQGQGRGVAVTPLSWAAGGPCWRPLSSWPLLRQAGSLFPSGSWGSTQTPPQNGCFLALERKRVSHPESLVRVPWPRLGRTLRDRTSPPAHYPRT